jgi:RHS repeat-associated protein
MQGKRGSAAQVRSRFTWDAAHQLAQVSVARGQHLDSGVLCFAYAYDALGRRVAKKDTFGTTQFGWDGDQLVVEWRGGNETHTIFEPGSFVPLAQINNAVLQYLHTDQLGTPLEASNDAGEITWQVSYKVWGSVVVEEIEGSRPGLRFQGQSFDVETGLHYSRFRYYDPSPGRFISQDPIGLEGGSNIFLYAPNPTSWTDPYGLKPSKTCECQKIRDKLQAHADAANANVGKRPNNGLTASQVVDVKAEAWKFAMHYGTQVHTEFAKLVRNDPTLTGKVSQPTTGNLRPDVVTKSKNCPWFDLTTNGGWPSHASKYKSLGAGGHISYSTPARSF